MYLRQGKTKNGRIHLSITQSYRNKEGKPTHKTLLTFGYLDKLAEEWKVSEDEALRRCKEKCKNMTDEHNKNTAPEYVEIKPNKRVSTKTTSIKNLGSAIPLAFYNAFDIESCIRNKFNKSKRRSRKNNNKHKFISITSPFK